MNRLACLAPVLLLAACSGEASAPAEQGGAASGQILAGSVSDAMIPLEQLTSQAPLAPRQDPVASTDGLDGEQPAVEPVEGIEGAPAPAEAPAAPAAAPAQPQ